MNQFVDLFCGAGGFSTGLLNAAGRVGLRGNLLAINHWERAIATHSLNHPEVRHLCESLDGVNPREQVPGRRVRLLCASPECTHHSNAAGGTPRNEQSRATASHVVRWAEALYIDDILVENVREFVNWGPLGANGKPLKSKKGALFRNFIEGLAALDYNVEWRIQNAANYGDATTRERFILIARRNRRPIVWPDHSHGSPKARLAAPGLTPWKPARDIIDWSLKGESIFARKVPLCANTMKRIVAGFHEHNLKPFMIMHNGTSNGHLQRSNRSVDEPVPTVVGSGRHIGLCEPFMIQTAHGPNKRSSPRGNASRHRSVDNPFYTIVGKQNMALIEPFLLPPEGFYRGNKCRSVSEPVPTICAGSGGKLALIEPFFIQTDQTGSNGKCHRSVEEPVNTIVSKQNLGLCQPYIIKYYGTAKHASVDEPLATITTKDRFALIQPKTGRTVAEFDLLYRLFEVHELAGAMSFPDYQFTGPKHEQVKQIGNAIPINLAEAHCYALLQD